MNLKEFFELYHKEGVFKIHTPEKTDTSCTVRELSEDEVKEITEEILNKN